VSPFESGRRMNRRKIKMNCLHQPGRMEYRTWLYRRKQKKIGPETLITVSKRKTGGRCDWCDHPWIWLKRFEGIFQRVVSIRIFCKFFHDLAFAVAVHLRKTFVDTKSFYNKSFVQLVFNYDYPPAKGL